MTNFRTAKYDDSSENLGIDDPNKNVDGNLGLTAEAAAWYGISTVGAVVSVGPFRVGEFSFSGGSISLPGNGAWFVGVELWSNQLRVLPRLGHRGWVPIARFIVAGGAITLTEKLAPVMPACRIPRAAEKVLFGRPLKIVVMGSSLAVAGNATQWAGMLAIGSVEKYKLPTTVTTVIVAKGGAPNAYGMAQLGYCGGMTYGAAAASAAFPALLSEASHSPDGGSEVFDGDPLVIIECLANDGDYRLSIPEVEIRELRKRGLEVIIISANAISPGSSMETTAAAALYVDGPALLRIADRYGVEFADTAAYVAEANVRASGSGIYSDGIHMSEALPAGVSDLPSCGHEAYVRAVRSVIALSATTPSATESLSFPFNGAAGGWVSYAIVDIAATGGILTATKNQTWTQTWGIKIAVAQLNPGDTIQFVGNVTSSQGTPEIGVFNGGWVSNRLYPAGGAVNGLITVTATGTEIAVLLASAPIASTLSMSGLSIVIVRRSATIVADPAPDRGSESRTLPESRVVTDFQTPGGCWVTLPHQEHNIVAVTANAGVLGAHPDGAASFARRWSSKVGASADLLTLTVGKRARFSCPMPLAFGIVYYAEPATSCTATLWENGVIVASGITLATSGSIERFQWIRTFAAVNASGAIAGAKTFEFEVTAGAVKIAALVGATPEFSIVRPEELRYGGAVWAAGTGGAPGMPGMRAADAGAHTRVRCPSGARRLAWLCSSNPQSLPVTVTAGAVEQSAIATAGAGQVLLVGSAWGPGVEHQLRLTQTGPGDDTNGYPIHVGGVLAVCDR